MSSSNKQPLNYSRGERVRAWSSISLPHIYTLFFFFCVLHRPTPNPTSWNVYSSSRRYSHVESSPIPLYKIQLILKIEYIHRYIYIYIYTHTNTHTHPSLISLAIEGLVLFCLVSVSMAILSPSYLTFKAKKLNLYKITITIILCTVFYLAGFYHNSRGTISINTTSSSSSTAFRCAPTNHSTTTLDFAARHFAQDPKPPVAREHHFPPCDPKYSEYTPCEDAERSLRFDRDRLVYRERHCPESHEILKCRVPPPYGYKVPFSWPESRELAWYANVPHKDLTVEKKNQNWVRVEGERLRFPGGGTMFPRGADAYIDDIGKLINLKDGSIRTAIDTGCGVRNIFTLFYPCVLYCFLKRWIYIESGGFSVSIELKFHLYYFLKRN